jgi:hypothetical protein
MPADMQELMTFEDVARLSKFKISALRKWVQLRKIPFVKINGAIRFNPEAIHLWATGRQGAEKTAALRTGQGICSRKRRGRMTDIEKVIEEA